MGELVLAAKVTHVPSMFISEKEGPLHGIRESAIQGCAVLVICAASLKWIPS